MIKIITKGKIEKRLVRCSNCECEFTFEREDIVYTDQRHEYESIKCPWCGKLLSLEVNDMEDNKWLGIIG